MNQRERVRRTESKMCHHAQLQPLAEALYAVDAPTTVEGRVAQREWVRRTKIRRKTTLSCDCWWRPYTQ